jgi:hypothetical protein
MIVNFEELGECSVDCSADFTFCWFSHGEFWFSGAQREVAILPDAKPCVKMQSPSTTCDRSADVTGRSRIGRLTKIAGQCVTAAAASPAARITSEGPAGGDRRRGGGGGDALSFPPPLPGTRRSTSKS